VKTIRPDTVFVPYHWPGKKSANLLTNRALDPISKIPEYKVCACRVERDSGMIGANDQFFIDPSRCIGCEACVAACMECDTHRGRSMIIWSLSIGLQRLRRARRLHALRDPACAQVCPADAIKQTEDGIVTAPSSPAASAVPTVCWRVRLACRTTSQPSIRW
jgi:predicted molibdopterin-dependent oxidoreductase YjgC